MNRVVISRKGLDSSFGRTASPIFPDGTMISVPIPDMRSGVRYRDVAGWGGRDLGQVVAELTGRRFALRTRAHLDPDLDAAAIPRAEGWRPAFGQQGGPQTHLAQRGVGVGSLFLFFGWFRRVEEVSGVLRPRRGAPDLHVLFGWLRVAEVIDASRPLPDWLRYHPHAEGARPGNTIYVGDGGVFRRFSEDLVLTDPAGRLRSVWRLPAGFPERSLSCHEAAAPWTRREDATILRSVGRGQEFVADVGAHPFIGEWAEGLVARASARGGVA